MFNVQCSARSIVTRDNSRVACVICPFGLSEQLVRDVKAAAPGSDDANVCVPLHPAVYFCNNIPSVFL